MALEVTSNTQPTELGEETNQNYIQGVNDTVPETSFVITVSSILKVAHA